MRTDVGKGEKNRFLVPALIGFMILGCGVQIIRPPGGGNVRNPVAAKVKINQPCGNPFQAHLDGSDVTSLFSASSTQPQATFPGLTVGAHTLNANAGVTGFFGGCSNDSETSTFNVDVDTPYMADCRVHGVPIPPDWAESGTAWILQGNLKDGTNLLQPGQNAFVWTYSDPNVRGACIALPRGSGGPGSLAGIICQSATTGHACFWDNKLRTNPAVAVGWSAQTLQISKLVDGSNLSENCTSCHRGDNVFLISPDDPTWRKVLTGTLSNPSTSLLIGPNFTTRVEGVARYIPLSTIPPRAGWENPAATGCAGACHGNPVLGFSNVPNPMPPHCATSGVADNCYN
jgi:hypothetical protein